MTADDATVSKHNRKVTLRSYGGATRRRNRTLMDHELLGALRALQRGDFSKRLPDTLEGVQGEICSVFNAIAVQAQELDEEFVALRLAIGRDGVTSRRIQWRPGVGGWGRYASSVNALLDDLTAHTDEIARVVTAVARGDLGHGMNTDSAGSLRGDFLRNARTVNGMVQQLSRFGSEVTRVAQEVGMEGKLGAQADVPGVSGTWKEITENVNFMANNLTSQVRSIAEVVTAVAQGDLGRKITVDARGEILTLKNTINATVDKLNHFSEEVTRVARLVGTEGTLGVQAKVENVSGIWKELTDNVNSMADNLTTQVRNIAAVTTAVANGDLSRKITVEVKGEILELKQTINAMVDSLSSFADEVTRMAREVGTEGVLGGQARVHDVSGIWKELTDNVNSMARNLTYQVRNIAEVALAVAHGDLSRKITVDARGEVLDLKNTINDMVDQLNAFGAEVTRVAREVGVEGRLGGQAVVVGGRGIWKELTNNVNLMASNLTNQVRDIAEVTTAVAKGDLTRKIAVDARGEILELKNTINTMVDQLSSFADQVTRLASDVGVEGKLGGQADVRGVSGTWRHLTDAVNSMAGNLTAQVRSIAQVAVAIAEGDLYKKIQVDARGEILELKNTINTMVDQLSSFAEEVTRVARDVGTEGKLGGQASVVGTRGTWKELTDNVNMMASNLTQQVRDISQVATAIARGDLGRKITVEVRGELLELKNTINTMVDQLSSFADEVTRVARDVGVEGKLGGQAAVRGVSGIWKELTDNVNMMASNLTNQVRDIAHVTTAVANGDLAHKITVEVRGEILELKNTINTMVDQLRSFADEVTRVAREVGTEGILGGQAQVSDVSGTWRELTDNVNIMARNLTGQVRGIARVVTAVANGDLKQELRLETKGEIATLVHTINNMIVTLSTFADQVSGVARDVGVEGKLGGQAGVPGAAGIWRDLTNNVNELAGNLTRQVRAIGDVATAVTKGDLTRSIDVDAQGEVALLKDNINRMIRALAETTRANLEQDWLKTNLTRFTRMLQGQRDLLTLAEQVLAELAPVVDAQHGVFYILRVEAEEAYLDLLATYACSRRNRVADRYALGEGLVGQAARGGRRIMVNDIPTDYIKIGCALGEASPRDIAVVPVLFEGEVKGVIELASVHDFTAIQIAFIEQLVDSLGIVVATIEAMMRTDELLRQSRRMAEELQAQQLELQQTNEQLAEKARQLTAQKDEVELTNREVELARQQLEEKAEQLALTSKYKSEFLANMSHELRTPLNSLLILARQLSDNAKDHLDEKETEYARTIYGAGSDLLALINEILDLAKIESGTIAIDSNRVDFGGLREYIVRSFAQMADEKGLELRVDMTDDLPSHIVTDEMRLRQVLRNLISNALKFTDTGTVGVRMSPVRDRNATAGRNGIALDDSDMLIAFSVRDTGIGIRPDQREIIFEAFQQSDGSTNRKYGGTGLGLSISREIATLLGGAIELDSEVGVGSTFTLLLPRSASLRHESANIRPHMLPDPSGVERTHVSAERSAQTVSGDRPSSEGVDRLAAVLGTDELVSRDWNEEFRLQGIRCITARDAAELLEIARTLDPCAIVLDDEQMGGDGRVMLDRLKHSSETRHIPLCVIATPENAGHLLRCGAVEVLRKPTDEPTIALAVQRLRRWMNGRPRRLLAVGSPERLDGLLGGLIGHEDLDIERVYPAQISTAFASAEPPDCVLVDDGVQGLLRVDAVLGRAKVAQRIPIVVHSFRALIATEEQQLRERFQTLTVQLVFGAEELLKSLSLFLHLSESTLAVPTRRALYRALHEDIALRGVKVLIVDDDVRNIFAITAVLESHGMKVVHAENGQLGLQRLAEHPDVAVVLMDVMMPEMDGYEATRRMRNTQQGAALPILALTAKAMRDDRAKCIEAGASDYVTKPVEPDQLVSLIRTWLARTREGRPGTQSAGVFVQPALPAASPA